MQFDVAGDSIAERDRFDVWHHTMLDSLAVLTLPFPDATKPFWGRMSVTTKGVLLHAQIDAARNRVFRKRREIARKHLNGYWVYREMGTGAWFDIEGQEFATRTGDFIIADSDIEMATHPTDHFANQVWMLPKPMVERHLPKSGRKLLARLTGRAGVHALTTSYLTALSENWDSIDEDEAGPVADTVSRLLGLALGAIIAEQPDAIRAGRLAQVKRFVEEHLAEPALSPASAAAALGISVRTLHAAFEPTGESFARHVLRARLDECRVALLANPARPVTDIAFAWGFNHLSAFYRAFQVAFGASPGELRAAAPRGGDGD